ncbi:hypothetical protein UNH65_21470 [Chitinophaga sp. 180180018-2]|nr:hypothetical protein [Chitinophaga sp. 212800010-3]
MVTQFDLADSLVFFQAHVLLGIRDQNSIWNLKLKYLMIFSASNFVLVLNKIIYPFVLFVLEVYS